MQGEGLHRHAKEMWRRHGTLRRRNKRCTRVCERPRGRVRTQAERSRWEGGINCFASSRRARLPRRCSAAAARPPARMRSEHRVHLERVQQVLRLLAHQHLGGWVGGRGVFVARVGGAPNKCRAKMPESIEGPICKVKGA